MNDPAFYLPAETAPHVGTIMAWPTKQSILDTDWSYPDANVEQTRKELARLAQVIAKYEPLHLFVLDPKSDDIDDDDGYASAKHLLSKTSNITIHTTTDVDSLWARDTAPVFVHQTNGNPITTDTTQPNATHFSSHKPTALILSFNQWGRKNPPTADSYFAPTLASTLSYPSLLAPFIAEGGALEVDGEGTLLATESSLLNPNRNPGIDKTTMESHFRKYLGVTKTIWLMGTRDEDITDDHIDGLARFARPGTVLLSKPYNSDRVSLRGYNEAKYVLSHSADAKGRRFRIVDVREPNPSVLGLDADDLEEAGVAVSYVNFHVVNGAVIVPAFGDGKADRDAARVIGTEFEGQVVEQVSIRQLGIQGGGIHCATQQIPR